jgi:hypothetical protein
MSTFLCEFLILLEVNYCIATPQFREYGCIHGLQIRCSFWKFARYVVTSLRSYSNAFCSMWRFYQSKATESPNQVYMYLTTTRAIGCLRLHSKVNSTSKQRNAVQDRTPHYGWWENIGHLRIYCHKDNGNAAFSAACSISEKCLTF